MSFTRAGTVCFADKPTKPKGPLVASNVFEDNCDLNWEPPEDDGGEPIEYYEAIPSLNPS